MARRPALKLDGWIVVDKDIGITSAEAVAKVRHITGAAKAGHAGTLDPLATGVLPVALGEATKTVSHVQESPKTYRFTVRWGEERDTDDAEGQVIRTAVERPMRPAILASLAAFTGPIEQVPPAYSAVKVAGERAYKLARQGAAAELAPRQVRIDRFVLLDQSDNDHATFEVDCGKGAYVRALARDLGRHLGVLGHISELRRTRVGPFTLAQAFSLDKLRELWQNSRPSEVLLPVETALVDIPALALTGPQADRLRRGQPVRVLGTADGTVCAMAAGKPVALAEIAAGEVRPVRVFNL